MVALWMPVVVLVLGFVIDTANWFEHKRHLQLQADAGALAGGGLFNGCFGDATTASGVITAETQKYAGDPAVVTRYNDQIGKTKQGTITVRINKKTFAVGGPPADDTVESVPCTAKMVDVKMTEAGLPWFLANKLVPSINARARVQIQQQGTSSKSLPVGVPDNNPVAAAAIYIDENNANTVLARQSLTKTPTTPVTLNGQSVFQWSAATPVSINVATSRIGIVVALSGQTGWTPPAGNLTAICNNVLVECYDVTQDGTGAVTAATGLDFIQGYGSRPPAGTPAAAIVRDVTLRNVGCTDASGPYFLLNSGCAAGVKAKIDFGDVADPSTIGAAVKVANYGCPNSGNPKGCPMTYHAAGPDAGYWTTDGPQYPTIPAAGSNQLTANAAPIDLNWQTNTSGNNKVFTGVQRAYPADPDHSGPVKFIRVDNEGGLYSNAVAFGTHNFSATVGVAQSSLGNQNSPTAPVVALKVVGGSATQAIDCDPSKANLRDELSTGCTPQYAINTGTACKAASYYVFPQSVPWDCTKTQPGGAVGQVSDGMLCRIYGVCYSGIPTCSTAPIHWRDSNGDGKITIPEDIPPTDPRLVSVFVTLFGALSGSGQNVIPISGFATFYVTGFSKNGGGQGDPCGGPPAPDPVPNKTGGYIVGHFIKYVDTLGGSGTGQACDFNAFGSCVAVLSR
jgi:hypothetical protein